MEYVESFNLFGTEVSQIPCIKGKGAPTEKTEGAVGCFYMDTDTDTGNLYKCTAVVGGVYTWARTGDGGTKLNDDQVSDDSTWSSKKLDGMFTEHNGAINELFTQLYSIVNDDAIGTSSTWSSGKLYATFGDIETALDSILAMQNQLIGGGSV